MAFYSFIRKFRELNGLRQLDIARATGTPQCKISNFENAKAFTDEEFIMAFAKAYNINDELKNDFNKILNEMGIVIKEENKIEMKDIIHCVLSFLTDEQKKAIAQELKEFL